MLPLQKAKIENAKPTSMLDQSTSGPLPDQAAFCMVIGSTVTITSSVGDTIRSENMAGARCSVWIPHHHVRMDHGLTLKERDIAAHPNHFVLTDDGNLLVHFALGIEPPQGCSIQCSDSGEMSTRNLILLSKIQQP